jgi:transposase-like protein
VAQRRYSDDDRANALAALAANGGNIDRTARQLGVPRATLQSWAKGSRHPEAAEDAAQKKGPLADSIEDLARKVLAGMEDKIEGARFNEAAVGFGILVDKMQLLRGKPTSIDKHDLCDLPDDELDRQLAAEERALAGPAPGEAAAPDPGADGAGGEEPG